MKLPKHYDPQSAEKRWQDYWEEKGLYNFSLTSAQPVYAIDTPPPTVSGDLHLGHCYSYSQTDFMARFWRMNGHNVYYPMGWDDNGLPTERLVEQRLGIKPAKVGREKFIQAIHQVSQEFETRYEQLWKRLGLSVDWRQTYTTISSHARKVSQYSFIDLHNKGLAYRASAPTIWCPTCGTAIAQAEVDDLERETNFITVAFKLSNGQTLPIATTRPELLPACVAVFVNPNDKQHKELIGQTAITPLFKSQVPILPDLKADPEKGTGVVMCCTFGDTTDVEWWYAHKLPLVSVITRDGTLNELAGPYAGLEAKAARAKITEALASQGLLLGQQTVPQTIRVHERCDTPVEYIETKQWFIKVLDRKQDFIEAGRQIAWHPPHMQARYENWVQNLGWDWCISRQRYYGVPFPVWYCAACGQTILADPADLPVDPLVQHPMEACRCGSADFVPDTDIMDTWATSSVSPQIAGKWLKDDELFKRVFPMSLRPQAHEIIRTWLFYTIVKALYHFGQLPWSNAAISGFGLAPAGVKLSKSKGDNPLDALAMMERYSADAVRYWAASTSLGRDSLVSEEKIASGNKLVTKLWNVAGFALRFLDGYQVPRAIPVLTPTDQWILARLQHVIRRATASLRDYDHVSAKDEVEAFFWGTLADNYVEMVKSRLYQLEDGDSQKESARFTLHTVLLTVLKLLAPITPFITEEIYQHHFAQQEDIHSIHVSQWPTVSSELISEPAELVGQALVGIATEVRRYKSAHQLPLGAPLARLEIASLNQELLGKLASAKLDIASVTRAQEMAFNAKPSQSSIAVTGIQDLWLAL